MQCASWADARRCIGNESDVNDVASRHAGFLRTMAHGAVGAIGARSDA
ncbi:hypothetical protein APY03_4300 [Variovorax sp. WDL1]|nr:hypothetical protein APY03_4300 [Variovorax sp. WDL1]